MSNAIQNKTLQLGEFSLGIYIDEISHEIYILGVFGRHGQPILNRRKITRCC